MTPLFITAIGKFIRQTKGWWIGLAILIGIAALIGLIVWVIAIGAGMWLIIPGLLIMFTFMKD